MQQQINCILIFVCIVLGSSPIKGPRCFLEQETLLSLLSTGWFQQGRIYVPGSRNGFERDLHKQMIACFTIKLK